MDVMSSGQRIHYRADGSGDAILLLHGHLHSGQDWVDAGYPALLDDFQVLVPDQLGYGHSDKPHDSTEYTLAARAEHLDAVLDAEGIDRAHVWGYSFGSTVAEAYARLRPDRTRSLVMGGTVPGMTAIDRQNIYGRQVPVYASNDWSRVWDEIYPGFDRDATERIELTNDLLACAASWEGSFEPHDRESEPMPTPMLCYAGTGDWFWEGARDVAEAAGGQFLPIDGADHFAAFRRAEEVVAGVRPFLLTT